MNGEIGHSAFESRKGQSWMESGHFFSAKLTERILSLRFNARRSKEDLVKQR